MSVKQTHSNPPVNRLILPPEIWTLVFRHATLVPDLISPDLCNYDKLDPIMRRQKKAFKQSLVTRRYLVRVSKAWYSSAICFLYESLLLGRGRVLASLCEALKRSHRASTDAPVENLPLGWWTKRIDIAMRDSTDDPNRDIALVGDIITMLPNLSIIIFDITGNGYFLEHRTPRTIPSSILQSTPVERLNVVYGYNEHAPGADDWLKFLRSRPHLRSISDLALRTFTAKPLRIPTVPHFPSLTSLHVSHSWTPDLFAYSELPNLQHLTYSVVHNYRSPEPFFQRHGAKLKSIMMSGLIPWMVDLISETCPNLVSMELIVNTWTDLDADISTLPSVNLMKLASRQLHSKRASYLHMFDFIVKVKTLCPLLKTVRLPDERNVTGLNAHPRLLRDQLNVLSAAGVALEDAEGRPFDLT